MLSVYSDIPRAVQHFSHFVLHHQAKSGDGQFVDGCVDMVVSGHGAWCVRLGMGVLYQFVARVSKTISKIHGCS